MEKRNCIFHVPFYINKAWASGTNIRPLRIIEGLEKCGYDVHVISGYGKERKEKIKDIKRKINSGMKFDFCYSESSTEPTLLTEKNHLPKYPFLDFGFMKFLKKKGIRIGLFYRDIYWRFPIYNSVPFAKRIVAKMFYMYDLIKYRGILDVLYLPHKEMIKYSPINMEKLRIEELPPAVDGNKKMVRDFKNDNPLKVFYVGGVSGLYDMTELFKAFKEFDNGELTVCCREEEWNNSKEHYSPYIGENIKVIHESGEGKNEHIKNSDICSLMFQYSEYRTFAMPLKLFEYMSFGKPMIATSGTATAQYIEEHGLGWVLDYDKESIKKQLDYLFKNKMSVNERADRVVESIAQNTWKSRAERIIEELGE